MIPRRQALTAPKVTPLRITPRLRGYSLPAWSPIAPSEGWTLDSARAAAVEYARTQGVSAPSRRVADAALLALLRSTPGFQRTEVVERLTRVAAPPSPDNLRDVAPF